MGVLDSYKYNVRTGIKPTPVAAAQQKKNQEEDGGGGGGGGSLLDQVIQGPQWGNTGAMDRMQTGRAGRFNPFSQAPNIAGSSNVRSAMQPENQIGYSNLRTNMTSENTLGSANVASQLVPEKPLGYSNVSTSMVNPPSPGFNKVARADARNTSTVSNPITQSQQDEWSRMTGTSPAATDQTSQDPAWLRGTMGDTFLPGERPIWEPTNWVNPTNPNTQETVTPIDNQPVGAGIGVNNTTGLLASILGNDTTPPVIPMGLTEDNLPINQTLPSLTTGIHPNAVPAIAGAANQSLAQYRLDRMTPGTPEYINAQALLTASQPKTLINQVTNPAAYNPDQAAVGGSSYNPASIVGLINPAYNPDQAAAGGSSYNPATVGMPAQTGVLSDATKQALKSDGYTDQEISALEKSRSGASQDKTVSGKNGAIYDSATGKEVNPWEKVVNTVGGKNVEESRGFTLEEIQRSKAKNLTTGFDYTNNTDGFTGEKVTLNVIDPVTGKNKVLPQIAGYYIAPNGKYFPIDLGIVKKLTQKGWGGGGGGGGGNWSSQGGNYKGWLASWNIGV